MACLHTENKAHIDKPSFLVARPQSTEPPNSQAMEKPKNYPIPVTWHARAPLRRYYPKTYKPWIMSLLLLIQGCSLAIPAGIEPVTDFDLNQYLGLWYEVARLDNRFERGLEQVTATYKLRKDGSIQVENAGRDSKTGKHRVAIGKAKPVKDQHTGHLKVSFFGPFYSSYVVFYLEPDYSVALVCSSNKSYCWILARKPLLTAEALRKYCSIAKEKGFAVENFVYPQASTASPAFEAYDTTRPVQYNPTTK